MYLKTLTIRGFKSFASATTFEFEPGVTAVVGPNGSGKSNVVDALAWVMGEQGAKTLRGGKMEDVIFAGTSGRQPLGRAQVSLTIDNTDGALPIDFTEVTISRTLFRSGGSEYAINNTPCRLLDIQELLSDSGLGREMHVIVGQGQLDRVLHATPEDRRGFIEESAGILKHRRRKEKTLRKLESTQANLDRLEDLTKEIARQLKPLGKQAATARRARTVQADLRDAKARLLADDLAALRESSHAARRAAEEAKEQLAQAQEQRALATGQLARLEAEAARLAPAAAAARSTWYELSTLHERYGALIALAAERRRLLGSTEAPSAQGENPERLTERAQRTGAEATEAEEAVGAATLALSEATAAREAAEAAQRAEDQRITALLRAVADRREGLAKLAGAVGTGRARLEAAQGERERAAASLAESGQRHDDAEAQLVHAQAALEAAETALKAPAAALAAAVRDEASAREGIAGLRSGLGPLSESRAALAARVGVLRETTREPASAARYLSGHEDALRGTLADLLTVSPGHEAAVQAGLHGAGEALLVASAEVLGAVAARDVADPGATLRLLDASPGAASRTPMPAEPPAGTRPVLDVVMADAEAAESLRALLGHVLLAEDDEAAARAAALGFTAVTAQGHRWEPSGLVLGGGGDAGALARRAALETATHELEAALEAEQAARDKLALAEPDMEAAGERLAQARRDHESARAAHAEAASDVKRLSTLAQQSQAEQARSRAAEARAAQQVAAALEQLQGLSERLETAQSVPEESEPSTAQRDALAGAATGARAAEVEARLAVRAAEERARTLRERERSLHRAAATEREARERAQRRAARRAAQAARAQRLAELATRVRADLARDAETAQAAVEQAEAGERTRAAALEAARAVLARANAQAEELAGRGHAAELEETQRQAKQEALEERAIQELGLTANALIDGFGPHLPVPLPEDSSTDKWAALRAEVDADGNCIGGTPYVRAEQERRLKRAERDLAELGKVNPLALEEFAALEERHEYLTGQLADLRASRQDLLDMVREVDDHVREVFASAYEDTAREFVKIFDKLFPGGEGRLELTQPDDLLTTGIEVHARPAGKKVKRLSLLSGGERALTAIALLVAIFTARPSPFYVMDEVEAALDERNLMRLLSVFQDLRQHSQLIVITHQKHTMDIADALYGVSMQGDGVTRVISQRIERAERSI